MNADCDNLDAYLAAELPASEAARFAEHLHSCDECREAVDQQHWIDGLLRDGGSEDSELPPDDVLVKLRASIDQYRPRRKQFAYALTAAAVLMVAVGWVALRRQAAEVASDARNQPAIATGLRGVKAEAPRATFVSDANSIAVPVKSRHADVTVIRVFPTLQRTYENHTAAFRPEGPVYQDWHNYSTGG